MHHFHSTASQAKGQWPEGTLTIKTINKGHENQNNQQRSEGTLTIKTINKSKREL